MPMSLQTHIRTTTRDEIWYQISHKRFVPLAFIFTMQIKTRLESENKATQPQIRNITFAIDETKQRTTSQQS